MIPLLHNWETAGGSNAKKSLRIFAAFSSSFGWVRESWFYYFFPEAGQKTGDKMPFSE